MRKPHSGLSFRPDLEGLRGVAILLVVAYHVGVPGVGGGYIGVDVFFVLSGYLITGLLQKELETTGRINLWEFYARRTRRLLPAASLVLIATLAAAWWIYPPFQQLRFTGTALATASYMSNLWFAKESTEYLAPNASANPFLHTWSLSVEEQFYLIWPTLMAITAFLALKTRATRSRMLVLCVLVIGAASFALESRLTAIAQPWAFFGSATRAWEFAVGGLGALLTRRLSSTPSALARAISWAGIAAVVGAAAVFD